MTAPRKANARRAPGGSQTTAAGNSKPTGGRREVQGFATDRNASQRPPAWTSPPGADAAADLEIALRHWGRP